VICELLGVPEADRPDFTRWAHVVNGGIEQEEHLPEVLATCGSYLDELAVRKLAAPGTDLMSDMARAEADGLMSRRELIGTAMLILIAGHDTHGGPARQRHP
jgi:cytochrome P450